MIRAGEKIELIEIKEIINQDVYRDMLEFFNRQIDIIPSNIIRIKPSDWAETRRVLPQSLSSMPGQFSFDVNPYLREIINCISEDSQINYVDVMKGTQIGFSVGVIENLIGWIIDNGLGAINFVTGDKATAEKNMELRIDAMLSSAGIQHKIFAQVEKRHKKSTGDTKSLKQFPGGFLQAIGPNSGSKLRNDSTPYLIMDELDASLGELKNEGDFTDAAEKRTDSFGDRRKILTGTTPTLSDISRIAKRFKKGTQEYYNIPCPHCNTLQPLEFFPNENGKGGIRYQKDEFDRLDWQSVYYSCIACEKEIKNNDKDYFLKEENGAKWVATARPSAPNRRSFHISSLYSPVGFKSWEQICQEWIEAQGDKQKLQAFYNQVLGVPWEDRTTEIAPEKIMIRKDGYTSGILPENHKALFCTMGVDVQGDRLEAEIVAWYEDKRSYSVDYLVISGDTSDPRSEAWHTLAEYITSDYSGCPVVACCIDAGFRPDVTYTFIADNFIGQPVYAIMGDNRTGARGQYFRKVPLNNYPIERVDLYVDFLKVEFYGYVQKSVSDDGNIPIGYCAFPDDYVETYYRGLTCETREVEVDKRGFKKMVWKNKKGRRNEPLDCRVYALGGLYIYAYEVALEEGAEIVDWKEFWTWARGEFGG